MLATRFSRRQAWRCLVAGIAVAPALRAATALSAAPPLVQLAQPAAAGEPPGPDAPTDYHTPGGYYFGQTGYSVHDDPHGPQFWSEMRRLGGVAVLGYPISLPFQLADGWYYQAFQRALLQSHPEGGQARLANSMDWLHGAGYDDWLASLGIPRHRGDDGSAGDAGRARAIRLGWLTNEPIRRHFARAAATSAATPEDPNRGIELFGLPTSQPEDMGPFVAQRFQRGVLQLWTVAIPGMPDPGTVVGALAGDLLRQAGLLPAAATVPVPPAEPALLARLAFSPARVPQGAVVVVRVWAPRATSVAGTLDGRPLLLVQRGQWWVALAGIPRLQPLGPLSLRLNAVDDGGARVPESDLQELLTAVSGGYPVETLWMGQAQLALLDPATVRAEAERLEDVTTRLTPQRLWSGPFRRPVQAPVTSPFGIRRSINGAPPTSSHSGTDYAAGFGTPVAAAAAGRVVLADRLTVRGNAVYIDHGLGVFSGYVHLSRSDVQVGETVQQGQVLGLVGSTGFSNGPHLHWELRVGGVPVAPSEWLGPAEFHTL